MKALVFVIAAVGFVSQAQAQSDLSAPGLNGRTLLVCHDADQGEVGPVAKFLGQGGVAGVSFRGSYKDSDAADKPAAIGDCKKTAEGLECKLAKQGDVSTTLKYDIATKSATALKSSPTARYAPVVMNSCVKDGKQLPVIVTKPAPAPTRPSAGNVPAEKVALILAKTFAKVEDGEAKEALSKIFLGQDDIGRTSVISSQCSYKGRSLIFECVFQVGVDAKVDSETGWDSAFTIEVNGVNEEVMDVLAAKIEG